ncbi:hypothetical protein JOC94_001992 [Bacillus thermophilus]|uniref:Uncharacterized protein n=1 Tax=Siminovitchia thermophila TaxID=1245522 RepID=A0ABS2R6J2_9BACI|nr:hypothetical protein [Siminovitchia thermophila]MBM7715020.1 hypothetical protein [Siminovitchia thermophila]ONK22383.1 hypothetical protein BLX87_16520 [Bacillus sp. VT-16-64]
MKNKGSWYSLPTYEKIFLIGIIIYIIILFLPWTYHQKILNISSWVWGAQLLQLLIPAVGIPIFFLLKKGSPNEED